LTVQRILLALESIIFQFCILKNSIFISELTK